MDCKDNPLDILFLVDTSGSVGRTNFKTVLRFVSSFADSFDIGPKKVQVGVTSFDDTVMPKIKLNQIYNKQALKNAINAIPHHGGMTATDKALAFARNTAFTPKEGGRRNVTQVWILYFVNQDNLIILH